MGATESAAGDPHSVLATLMSPDYSGEYLQNDYSSGWYPSTAAGWLQTTDSRSPSPPHIEGAAAASMHFGGSALHTDTSLLGTGVSKLDANAPVWEPPPGLEARQRWEAKEEEASVLRPDEVEQKANAKGAQEE